MNRSEHEADINARQSALRQQSRVPAQQSQQQQQQHATGHPGVAPTAFVEPGQPLALTPAPPMHAQHQLQQQPHAQRMEKFWMDTYSRIQHELFDYKSNQNLPLARIKKVMKTDEEVKMISSEVPVLFAKACDIFIMDITLRAWLFAEECKRRTLQRSDIANSIRRVDMFDFLIDIVPRDEKPTPAKTEKLEYNDQPAAYPYGYGVPQGGQYPSEDQKIMDSMVAYQQQQMRYMQIDPPAMMHETHPQGAQPHHHEHHPHAFHAQPGSSATHPQFISDTPPAAGQPAAGYPGGYYQQSPAVQQAFPSHQSDQHRHPHAPHAHPHQHQHDQHATPHTTQPGASHHPHVPGPHGHGNDVAPVKYEYDAPIPGPNEWYHPAASSSGVPTHSLPAGYVQEASQAGQPLGPGSAAPGFNHSVDGRGAMERK